MGMGGACGARSGLVDFWVMHGMVMDETLHVFPGGWVAGVLRVYVDVWLALVGLSRAGRCGVASWLRDGLRGAVVVSWRPADGNGGRVRGAEWFSGLLGHARHGNG